MTAVLRLLHGYLSWGRKQASNQKLAGRTTAVLIHVSMDSQRTPMGRGQKGHLSSVLTDCPLPKHMEVLNVCLGPFATADAGRGCSTV